MRVFAKRRGGLHVVDFHAEDIPHDTSLVEVAVIAHRPACAILEQGPCDCRPPVGATSVTFTP